MPRTVLVFAKNPIPGRVKTRLAASIGDEAAAGAYRRMACRVFEQLRRARPDRIVVAFDPVEEEAEVRAWLAPWLSGWFGDLRFVPQEDGDLGARLEHAVAEVFSSDPEGSILVVGTDCIDLDRGLLDEAWAALSKGTDIVFGPSGDGGYYLVGLAQPTPELFRGIPWSTPDTLVASLRAVEDLGRSHFLLPERSDVDTAHEWKTVEPRLRDRPCVFFDRDGVVNESPGPGYVERAEDFHLRNGIAEALAWLEERSIVKILVTSQKGVGKGIVSREELDRIHGKMQAELAVKGAPFDGIYAYTGEPDCPIPPKPDPGMIDQACESFFLDRRLSWLVGDADRDIEMGKAAGLVGTIRVLGDHAVGTIADYTIESSESLIEVFLKILKF